MVAEELEGGVAAVETTPEQRPREEPPSYPTHLEAGVVASPSTPDEVLATLNHLALEDVVNESQFQDLYLHHFGPLGASPGAAHHQWEALKSRQAAERAAAQELAQQMQAAIADVRPWNPNDEPDKARAETNQLRSAFNAAVDDVAPEAAKKNRTVASHLKDRIASELSQRTGLQYDEANKFVAAWAGTSNDHNWRSIALQMAAAEKFGVEPSPYLASSVAAVGAHANWQKGKEDARRVVDAMYEHTQEWLSSRGIKELVLFRGMRSSIGADTKVVAAAAEPIEATVHLNPLNSWSGSYSTAVAESFSGHNGYLLTARVPASKVIGCCFTGLGCLHEQEFVMVGAASQHVTAVANKNVQYNHLSGGSWKT